MKWYFTPFGFLLTPFRNIKLGLEMDRALQEAWDESRLAEALRSGFEVKYLESRGMSSDEITVMKSTYGMSFEEMMSVLDDREKEEKLLRKVRL